METINKLKKILNSEEGSEKIENVSKLVWEMTNLKKLQTETIEDMNRKIKRHFKIKKENLVVGKERKKNDYYKFLL